MLSELIQSIFTESKQPSVLVQSVEKQQQLSERPLISFDDQKRDEAQHIKPNLTKSFSQKQIKKQFPCPDCEKSFQKPAHLLRHQNQRHKGERTFKCSFEGCEKVFKRDSHLRRHFISHTHEKAFQCQQCCMKFGYKHHLDRHIKVKHKHQLLKCEQCDEKFLKKKSLSKHILQTHQSKESTQGESFSLNLSVKIPKTNKKIRKISKDEKICLEKTQKSPMVDQDHQQKSEQKIEPLFRCIYKECLQVFETKFKLFRHIKCSKSHGGMNLMAECIEVQNKEILNESQRPSQQFLN